jgi:hypothetical protein
MRGRVPGLPTGLSYSPAQIVELPTVERETATVETEDTIKSMTAVAPVRKGSRRQSVLNPNVLLDVNSTRRKSFFQGRGDDSNEVERLPEGTSLKVPIDAPKRRFPPGFVGVSPFPGFDFNDRNANKNEKSPIYSDGMYDSSDIPAGFTKHRHPVLYPSRDNETYGRNWLIGVEWHRRISMGIFC